MNVEEQTHQRTGAGGRGEVVREGERERVGREGDEDLARLVDAYCEEYKREPFQRAHMHAWLVDRKVRFNMERAMHMASISITQNHPHSLLASSIMKKKTKTARKHPYERSPIIKVQPGSSTNMRVEIDPRPLKRSSSKIMLDFNGDISFKINGVHSSSSPSSSFSRASPKKTHPASEKNTLSIAVKLPDEEIKSFIVQPTDTVIALRDMVGQELKKRYPDNDIDSDKLVLKTQQGFPYIVSDFVSVAMKNTYLVLCYLE